MRAANPDLAAARLRIAEARGRLVQSGRLSNPEVEFGYNRNTANPREHTLGVALLQRFPVTARLRFEKAVSQAQLAAAEAEVADVERKLIAQARTVAVKLAGFTPETCALPRAVPAAVPSVHTVAASPRLLVVVVAGVTEPEPGPTSQSTRRFATGLLLASVTTTWSVVVSETPATPVC